jgi:cell wall-associated NlpC family hydrolase
MRLRASIQAIFILSWLAGCGLTPVTIPPAPTPIARANSEQAVDVVMYALSLRDTGYTFGGKNPEAGLDCSGMVTHTYQKAIGKRLAGNAAKLAQQGRPVARQELRAGDLVFFNTLGRPFSHVGIFIGGDEFIHAPNSKGRVRVDRLTNGYYASRYEMGRTLLD